MFVDEHAIWPRRAVPPPRPTPARSRRERVLMRLLPAYAPILLLAPLTPEGATDLVRPFVRLLGR